MKYAHNITVTVFACGDEEICREKLLSLIPFSPDDEKVRIDRSKAEGLNDNTITIFKVRLDKDRHTTAFLKSLASRFDLSQREKLIRQLDSRLDEHLDFFLRLDKQSLLKDHYRLTDRGDCFHIRIVVAAFPHKRDVAELIVKEIFS